MTLIKDVTLGLATLIFSYAILIIGDWYIVTNANQDLNKNTAYLRAKAIEHSRQAEEDMTEKELAERDGFLPVIYPSLLESLDLPGMMVAGMPETDTYYCNEGYGLVRYRSDRFGFRNNEPDWDVPSKSIVIGDSFVHGACVASNQTLPAILSKVTGNVVLNLGMGGNNPSHYLTYGSLFIPKIEPEFVYVIFYPNDRGIVYPSIQEHAYVVNERELFSRDKLELLDVEQSQQTGREVIRNLREKRASAVNHEVKPLHSRIGSALWRHATLPSLRRLAISAVGPDQTERAIYKIKDLCADFKCKLRIVFIPNSKFYRPDRGADDYGDHIAAITKNLNIPFFDTREILDRSEGSKDYAIKGPHLSPKGYLKVANFIASHRPK